MIFYTFGCATTSSVPPASQAGAGESAPEETQLLSDIQVVDQNGFMDVLLIGSDAMTYTAFKAIDPLRLVLDLPNTESEITSSPLAVENEIIGKIETMSLAQEPQPLTRVEIALNQEAPYEIFQEQNLIRVQFEQTASADEMNDDTVTEMKPAAEQLGRESQTEKRVSPTSAGKQQAPATKITAIQPIASDEQLKVYIIGNGNLDNYNLFTLKKPARLVVDLMGVKSVAGKGKVPPSDRLVKDIRVGTHADKIRVVFDLIPANGLPYQVTSVGDRLVVSFEPGSGFPASPPIVMAKPAAPPKKPKAAKPTPPPSEPAKITSIDFKLLEKHKSRLIVAANRPVEPEIQITGPQSISLILPNAKLPKHLQRHIDTGQFTSAVNVIYPRPMEGVPGTIEFQIELREMVPYHVAQEDNAVYLDFDSSTMPPPEPIKLGKPTTVVEERAPEVVVGPEEAQPPAAPEEMAEEAPPEPVAEEVAAEEEALALKEAEAADEEAMEVAAPVQPERETMRPAAMPRKFAGQKISLDLQEVDIRNVLRLLADVTGKNIVVEPNVKGTVTLKVDNVPWDQVLELILKINDLDSVMEGNVIRIATAAKIKAELDRKRDEVEAKKELMAAARDLGEISTEYLQVNYADVSDISSQIDNVKSDKGTLSVDSRTNLIIYSDFPRRIQTAKEILARLDRPTPQVMIESRIVSANTNFSRNLGISWSASYTANSLAGRLGGSPEFDFAVAAPTTAIGSFGLNFARTIGVNNILDLDMQLDALEQAGEGRVISSPRIFTLDHVQAMIQQGDQIPYPQRTEEGTISTAFAPATLSLTVTPHITPDGKVRLEVLAKKDEADFSRTVQDVPAIRTQEAQTELLVNDGDTIVIGGIVIQDTEWSEDRVPFLWRIPLLGWLFKNRQIIEEKTELLIFLSPSIVADQQMTKR
jgi:type IV pilus assembly protein PilQ